MLTLFVLLLPPLLFIAFDVGVDFVLASFSFDLNFENLNITIKTSTLDYNGERYLSSIINCVIFRL